MPCRCAELSRTSAFKQKALEVSSTAVTVLKRQSKRCVLTRCSLNLCTHATALEVSNTTNDCFECAIQKSGVPTHCSMKDVATYKSKLGVPLVSLIFLGVAEHMRYDFTCLGVIKGYCARKIAAAPEGYWLRCMRGLGQTCVQDCRHDGGSGGVPLPPAAAEVVTTSVAAKEATWQQQQWQKHGGDSSTCHSRCSHRCARLTGATSVALPGNRLDIRARCQDISALAKV